ncbi:MAG: EF-hand domain-containing protein [Pseudomonadota bacterium]
MIRKAFCLAGYVTIALGYPSFGAGAFFEPSPERILSMMDQNEDGSVSREEMVEVIVNRRGGSAEEAEFLFSCLDGNGDERVDLVELEHMWKTRESIEEKGAC